MLNRAVVMISGLASDKKFALVLQRLNADNHMRGEEIARSDSYALTDFWATMYNVGHKTLDECKAGLEGGFQSVPSTEERGLMERARVDPEFRATSDE
jgi:hypothetical protein